MFGRSFNIGFLLLAIYLLLIGIIGVAGLAISPIITSVFALLAGIFLLIGR